MANYEEYENQNDIVEEFDSLSDYEQRKILGDEQLQTITNLIDNTDDPELKQKYLAIWVGLFNRMVTDAKNNSDAELRAQALEEMERKNRSSEILDMIGKGIMVGTTAFTGWMQWRMFKRSTKKEFDEAILTTTDKTVVTESLKGSFWRKFFGK